MRKFFGAAALLMATTGLTQAQSIYSVTVNGDTTGAPTWNRVFGFNPPSGFLSGAGTDTPYHAIQVRLADPASFFVEVVSAVFDTTMALYQGDFDPSDQFTNWVGYDDDGGFGLFSRISQGADGPFAEGDYTIVVTGFSNDDFGTYVLMMDGVILGWGPTTTEQLEELKAVLSDGGRNTLSLVTSNVSGSVQNSFASRSDLSFSTKGEASALMGNVYAWVKGGSVYAESPGRTYRSPMLQVGADVGLGDSVVAGAAVGFGDITARSTGFAFEGSQTVFQPYIGFQNGDWEGSASITYGKIDYNSITTISGVAGVEGEMLAFSGEVARVFDLDAQTTLAPFVGYQKGQTKLTATSGTLAGAGLNDTVNFSEARLGVTLTTTMDNSIFSFGISADHFNSDAPTALFSGAYDATGWSGSATFGYSVNLSDATSLDTSVSFGGFGTQSKRYAGSLQLRVQF